MDYHKEYRKVHGYLPIIDDPAICQHIKFGLLTMNDGEVHESNTEGNEACLVILGGQCNVEVGGQKWEDIGRRRNVFDGKPTSIYIPRDSPFRVEARGEMDAGLCMAPASESRKPSLIPPEDVKCLAVGSWNWTRTVCDIMGNDSKIPQTLIVGETINPPGNWSSSPPHKHDVDDLPRESKLEEVYFYKLKPSQGFALQRIYSADGELDESYVIKDGDTVAFPRGYHPVVAAPGYQLYYLWVLAGKKRIMRPNDDPDHAWVKDTEPIISDIIG